MRHTKGEIAEAGAGLHKAARAHCIACRERDGACIMMGHDRECNLAAGTRCTSFARCVLPGRPELRALYDVLPMRGPGDVTEWTAVGARGLPDALQIRGGARYCACGAVLAKRRRLCDVCRDRRRRESTREAVSAHRAENVSS